MAFIDDIQSRDTALFPVVTFALFDGSYERISTKPFTLDGEQYSPLLLSSPSIKESIDLENRKYKISNVSLKISNVEYNGFRFTDSQILLNTEVSIHWVSPSCTIIDDCYLAYRGTVRAITHDEKICNIKLEDISQSSLHRDVPITLLGTTEGFTDKYKNKPVPMVYGTVDRSPCVMGELPLYNIADTSASEINILTDHDSTVTISAESPLAAFSGGAYVTIAKDITTMISDSFAYVDHPFLTGDQYSVSENIITLLPVYSDVGLEGNPIAENHIIGHETVAPSAVIPLRANAELQTWNEEHYATLNYAETTDGEYGSVLGRWKGSVFRESTLDSNNNTWSGNSLIPDGDGSDIWWTDPPPGNTGSNPEGGHLGAMIQTPITGSTSYIEHFGHLRAEFNTYIYSYGYWSGNQDKYQYARTQVQSKGYDDGWIIDTALDDHANTNEFDLPYYDNYSDSSVTPHIILYEPAEVQFVMYFREGSPAGSDESYGGGGAGAFEIYKWKTDHYMLMDNMLKLDFYANDVTGRE